MVHKMLTLLPRDVIHFGKDDDLIKMSKSIMAELVADSFMKGLGNKHLRFPD